MARMRRSWGPAGTLSSVNRPSCAVRVPRPVPATETSAPTMGASVAAAVTRPVTIPVWAAACPAASASASAVAADAATARPPIRLSTRPPLQRQLQSGIIEPAVHAELRDSAAVNEAAEADVRRLHLLIRVGVEDVVPADGEPDAPLELVREVQIEERLGAEPLVVGRVARVPIEDRAVIGGPRESGEAPPGVTCRQAALLPRERVLEAVSVLADALPREKGGLSARY